MKLLYGRSHKKSWYNNRLFSVERKNKREIKKYREMSKYDSYCSNKPTTPR